MAAVAAALLGPSLLPYFRNAAVSRIGLGELVRPDAIAPPVAEPRAMPKGAGAHNTDWMARMHRSQGAFLKVGEPWNR